MKLFLLKRKLRHVLLMLSFALLTATSNQICGNTIEDPYYGQIGQTLSDCLCNKTKQESFVYFVDHLIEILKEYASFLESHQLRSKVEEQNGGITGAIIQTFIQDLQKIRNSKNVMQVGLVLSKYKRYLPGDMKRMTLAQLAAGLKYRLARPA